MSEEATPRPWEQLGDLIWAPEAKANVAAVSVLRATSHVAYTAPDFGEKDRAEIYANARLIVRAVNSHDALVAAVREALKWQDEDEFGNAVPDEYCTPLYRAYKQQLRDALKLAEPSQSEEKQP